MKYISIISFLVMLLVRSSYSFIQPVFYHADYFSGEPRFARKSLTTFDCMVGGGSAFEKNDAFGKLLCDDLYRYYRINTLFFTYKQNLGAHIFFTTTLPVYRIHAVEGFEQKFDCTSASNMNVTAGCTFNYGDTELLDFIDTTIEMGIIIPSAKKPAQSKGIPIQLSTALGLFNWISCGGQAMIIGFFDHSHGTMLHGTSYIKADHCIGGLSFLLGYSYTRQSGAPIPWSNDLISYWNMHTLNCMVSYDFACESFSYVPRLEIFYNHILGGKNIIVNSMFGCNLGIDF